MSAVELLDTRIIGLRVKWDTESEGKLTYKKTQLARSCPENGDSRTVKKMVESDPEN